ncbi:MAG: alpha/beta hydrolase family protein [Actinomycetales bacterium]
MPRGHRFLALFGALLVSVSLTAGQAWALPETTDEPQPVSLPALMATTQQGSDFTVGRVLARNNAYTKYAISYRSNGLKVTGIMNVPKGKGPFPVIVMAHGYIDPDVYVTGQGFRREQDALARAGYIALHVDYRNHAGSDDDPRNAVRLRLGYTEDVINAARAAKASRLPYVDGNRIGFLGRSMGGGVGYNALVTAPGTFKAAVLYAPVSADAVDNFNKWQRSDTALRKEIFARYGSPETNPEWWAGISAINYFDRITDPLLIVHGTADDSCPIAWTRRAMRELRRQSVDAELIEIKGGGHYLYGPWAKSFDRTLAFFDEHVRESGSAIS